MEEILKDFEKITSEYKTEKEEIYESLMYNGFERKNPIDFVYTAGTLGKTRGTIKVTVTNKRLFVTVSVKDAVFASEPVMSNINNLKQVLKEAVEKIKHLS